MRKVFAIFITACVCMAGNMAMAADFQVKKASAVQKQETSGLEAVASNSLVPGVLNLVANVNALNKQQKELAAECQPTDSEIRWVNEIVKEYAMAAGVSPADMLKTVGGYACTNNDTYKSTALINMPEDNPCTETFPTPTSSNSVVTVWAGFPKAEKGEYCTDGTTNCPSSKRKIISNVYTVFDAIGFSKEDYLESESDAYTKFIEKAEKCSSGKIAAQKKAKYAEFIKDTITGSGSGQQTTSPTIWSALENLTATSDFLGGVGQLAVPVAQMFSE